MDKVVSGASSQAAMSGMAAAQGVLGLWQAGMGRDLTDSAAETQSAWIDANTEAQVATATEGSLVRFRQLEAIMGTSTANRAGRGLRGGPSRIHEASAHEYARDYGMTQRQIKLIRLGADGEKAGVEAGAATRKANLAIKGFSSAMNAYNTIYKIDRISEPASAEKKATWDVTKLGADYWAGEGM